MTRYSNSSSGSSATEIFPSVPDDTISAPHHVRSETEPAMGSPTDANPASARPRVHYPLNVDTQQPHAASRLSPLSAPSPGLSGGVTRSDTDLSRIGIRRRNTRANTFKTIQEYDEPGWHPGAEPGVDTSKPDGGHAGTGLHAECQITIVDFSPDHFAVHELDNSSLVTFLEEPQPEWVHCRWINVNGLSWDVIQALGIYKNLHSLALEDIMSSKNRTKVDW